MKKTKKGSAEPKRPKKAQKLTKAELEKLVGGGQVCFGQEACQRCSG